MDGRDESLDAFAEPSSAYRSRASPGAPFDAGCAYGVVAAAAAGSLRGPVITPREVTRPAPSSPS